MTKTEFYEKFAKSAMRAHKGTNLFASLALAQAALESGYAKSELSSKYFNFFGIKADNSWKGRVVTMRTREQAADGSSYYVNAKFRAYENAEQSFKDRAKFLQKNPRYTKAGVFKAKTPFEQAELLEKAGYATATNYNEVLTAMILQNGLEALDAINEKKNT